MKFVIPIESIIQNKGGVILYDPIKNKILKQYVHYKKWKRSGWRGGILYGDHLIATDWQDLHYFHIPSWKYHSSSYTFSTFNDLHYLAIKDGLLYIVNTGIDAIEIFSNPINPEFQERIFIFDRIKKYKKKNIDLSHMWNEEYKTHPHHCHPNCITLKDDYMFVTCFENETRDKRTGNIVELSLGQVVVENRNCHDGNFYKNDFYFSGTRENKIYIIRNLLDRKWPIDVDESIKIGKPGWWRGMIIHKDILYVFASYAYGEDQPCKMAVIDIKNKKVLGVKRLPVHDGIKWDTVYQPLLLEERKS